MANATLIIWFLSISSFLFCQTPGLYRSKRNALEIEIFRDDSIKFKYLNLGSKDSVILSFNLEGDTMTLNYSYYKFQFEQFFCQNENYGLIIKDNLSCFERGYYINDIGFSSNFVSFNQIASKSNNDSVQLKIIRNCNNINFEEHLIVNKNQCYHLSVDFNLKSFDFKRFEKIWIKNKRVIIVDGVKYFQKLQRLTLKSR